MFSGGMLEGYSKGFPKDKLDKLDMTAGMAERFGNEFKGTK